MSCKGWKRRTGKRRGYGAWDARDDAPRGDDAGGGSWGNSWQGNPWGGAAWSGPGYGFWGGRNFRILSGLRRDPWRGKVSGVCAGLSGYYGINLKLIRIAAIVAFFINPFLAGAAYAAATFLMPTLPDQERAGETPVGGSPLGGSSEMNAGSSARRDAAEKAAEEELPPELRFAALKDKFRELETRTGEMEGLVTSKEFHLRRDFKKMGEGGDTRSA